MRDRSLLLAAVGVFLLGLVGPTAALASVKCQCNNGSTAQAMGADYDDDDVEDSCNDACSMLGGGRVWNVDTDQSESGSTTVVPGVKRTRPGTASPRR